MSENEVYVRLRSGSIGSCRPPRLASLTFK
jgi:hypothetical protein